jgi:putative redox protein
VVQIEVVYEGSLRCRATHAPSGRELVTDAPVDNQGKGESFSPTDLVATALGACMLTIMGIAAQKHGLDLTGARITVKKHMRADPERRIGRLEAEIVVPRALDERSRRLLEKAALTCPVHKSLHPSVEAPVVFRWGD